MPNRECPKEWMAELKKVAKGPYESCNYPILYRMVKRGLVTHRDVSGGGWILTTHGRAELKRLEENRE
jgi:DNA-binding PadR family transcriptional regulator